MEQPKQINELTLDEAKIAFCDYYRKAQYAQEAVTQLTARINQLEKSQRPESDTKRPELDTKRSESDTKEK